MVQTGGQCGVLGLLHHSFLSPKNSKVNIFIYIEQCFVWPNCTSSNKTVTFECLIDVGVAYKPYKTPC